MNQNILTIPNILSGTRIILAILFSYLLTFIKTPYMLNYIFLIFLTIVITDYLDGQIARKTETDSEFGAKLDIIADMFYLTSSYMVLSYLNIIPLWFLIFLIIKFMEFIITSNNSQKEGVFLFDKMGKYMAIISMGLPGMITLLYILRIRNIEIIVLYISLILTFIGIMSLIKRIIQTLN